jgi:hypothetical protein
LPVSADARLAVRFLKKLIKKKGREVSSLPSSLFIAGLGGGTLNRPAGWDYEGHAPRPRLLEIEAVEVHDFGPGGDEVVEEFFL